MTFELIILTIILLLNIFILISFLGSPNKPQNIRIRNLFSLIIIGVIIWIISILLTDLYAKHTVFSLWTSRISFLSSAIIVIIYYFFVDSYKQEKKLNNFEKYIVIPLGIIFSLISLTPLILENVTYDINTNKLVSIFGKLYITFPIYIGILFIFSAYIFFKIYKKEQNLIRKYQIFFILIGTSLSIISALFTNIILPLIFKLEIRALGPFSLIFFLLATYYAIIRYQFLSIRTYLGKIIYSIAMSIIPYIAFFTIYFTQTLLYRSVFSIEAIITGYFIAILFIYILFLLNDHINKYISKYILYKKINPERITLDFLNKISTQLDFHEIIKLLLTTIQEILNPHRIQIIIKEEKIIRTYTLNISSNEILSEKNYTKTQKLYSTLSKSPNNKIIIFYDELKLRESNKKYNSFQPKDLQLILKYMTEYNISLIYSYKNTNNAPLILLFDKKIHRQPYTINDLQILHKLITNTHLALDRANLHQQVKNFAITLQSEIKKATKKLTLKNIKLKQTLQRERELLDILGHELRTPLTISKNAALFLEQQIQEGKLTDEKLNKYLAIAVENLKRESSLVETLLSTTKIDNKSLDLTFTKVDIIDAVNDSFEIMIPRSKKKNLQLTFTHDKKVFAYADRNRTQEIIDNLIDNAIKYTVRGKVTVNAYTKKDKIYVEVIDTGVGISKEDLKNLGQKFYRTNTYVKSSQHKKDYQVVRPGGTGLGLYVTFNLAKAMYGEVAVESELDKGSKFTLILPKYTNQEIKHTKDQENTFEKFKRLKKEREKNKKSSNK